MPNSISICSLMRFTNVTYKSSPKRARTGPPDLEVVPVGGAVEVAYHQQSRKLTSHART